MPSSPAFTTRRSGWSRRACGDVLERLHFWGWQAIIVAAAVTLPLGFTQSKEYAELEWPIDIAIAPVWVAFTVNVLGTLAHRRERHLYVALWFYIATLVAIPILHIFNNLVVPAGFLKSYSLYAGVQDAFMQWWYGHNAVAFFLTTPFLGPMYYYLPKAADRPDPAEQRRRFEAELEVQRRRGRPVHGLPETFLHALPALPPCAGNALGVDRLVMLFADAAAIDEVVAFTPDRL